jgi:hypothetical protein
MRQVEKRELQAMYKERARKHGLSGKVSSTREFNHEHSMSPEIKSKVGNLMMLVIC